MLFPRRPGCSNTPKAHSTVGGGLVAQNGCNDEKTDASSQKSETDALVRRKHARIGGWIDKETKPLVVL